MKIGAGGHGKALLGRGIEFTQTAAINSADKNLGAVDGTGKSSIARLKIAGKSDASQAAVYRGRVVSRIPESNLPCAVDTVIDPDQSHSPISHDQHLRSRKSVRPNFRRDVALLHSHCYRIDGVDIPYLGSDIDRRMVGCVVKSKRSGDADSCDDCLRRRIQNDDLIRPGISDKVARGCRMIKDPMLID